MATYPTFPVPAPACAGASSYGYGAYPAPTCGSSYPHSAAAAYPGNAAYPSAMNPVAYPAHPVPGSFSGSCHGPPPPGYPTVSGGVGQYQRPTPAPEQTSNYPPPMGSGAAPGSGLSAVVSPQYCTTQQVTLKAMENPYSISGDDFTICDAQTGSIWFKMDARAISMREKRVLKDSSGRAACCLSKDMLTLRAQKWNLYAGGDFRHKLAVIRPKFMSVTPKVLVMLNDGDKEPDYVAKGNILAKKFEVYQVKGKAERLVAWVKKESRFASSAAYIAASVHDKQSYYINAEPGMDLAFLTALCVCMDEIWHD